ncbi:MAG: hypothetical protein A2Y03_03640 [Omnitrophica WOR_2 bacterium GWF2_38_59]|nr:MAG: hypothetical protein A2Y03_03640 [Omnitrophica WOR_2 bacterium GWF2_38_59]OGX55959.1 MAG: hypothetical protein A2447_03185 [Omnitrophica WOR_2 bacterium RIFOXYC2_FULL_38_12]
MPFFIFKILFFYKVHLNAFLISFVNLAAYACAALICSLVFFRPLSTFWDFRYFDEIKELFFLFQTISFSFPEIFTGSFVFGTL